MIFFQHPEAMAIFALFFYAIHNIWDQIQIEYFPKKYLRVILTSESTQKSTIRKHPFRHSFTKLVIVSYLRTFLLNHHLHCLRLLHCGDDNICSMLIKSPL